MPEKKVKEPTGLDIMEAHNLLKKGGRVKVQGQKEGIYYLIRGPKDDPCIKEETVFVHTIDGQLSRSPLPAANDPTQKIFVEVK